MLACYSSITRMSPYRSDLLRNQRQQLPTICEMDVSMRLLGHFRHLANVRELNERGRGYGLLNYCTGF